MDPLSQILRSMRMEHTRVGTLDLGTSWGIAVDGFELPTAYGVASGATCWLSFGDETPIELRHGDIVLVRGPHRLRPTPMAPTRDMAEVMRLHGFSADNTSSEPNQPVHLRWEEPATTRLIGLAFGLLGGPTNPLLASLPRHVLLRRESKQFPWLDAAVDFLTSEHAGTAGYAAMARMMAELVFVSILRYHVLEQTAATQGWLRGLTDPTVAKALLAIHEDPSARWSVKSLASRVHLSRTAFALRFAALVQVTPIEYLTQWRMHLAAERIQTGRVNLTQLAYDLGYASDAAFRNAFKSRHGMSPSQFAKEAANVHGARTNA